VILVMSAKLTPALTELRNLLGVTVYDEIVVPSSSQDGLQPKPEHAVLVKA
jgi:hypothetical protein